MAFRTIVTTLALAGAVTAAAGEEPIGHFQAHGDIGSPKLAGGAVWNAASQEYTFSAAGVNMWGARDEFHFAWRKMTGDFILQTRVELLGTGVDPHRKLGLMVRATLDADSPYADAAIHGDGLTSLQYRRAKGAITEQIQSAVKAPDFVQLERKGDTFTLSVARFGEPLTTSRLDALPLGTEAVYVGLFLCSHNPEVVEQGVFKDVRIIRPVKDGFTPYRDYIGSVLELLDVASGRRQVVHRSPDPFEAPNWTTDGSALLYNTSGRGEGRGRIHRFDLATRQSTPLDTGTANRNNNDHVLSFDGKTLGISDQSVPPGQSTVYTLPASGGTPRRVTALTPSYLHGFSPDGRYVVYTGGRNGEFDIYRMAADGSGEEQRLTDFKGLDDGPEYSPDGRYIYFNSVRSGLMQLFRMGPDGRDPERVSTEETNNWFPHPSPDGKWIAYLGFPKDIDPADHPYYKHVTLRVMPAAGGPSKVVAYIYGGQGTINVPSWSPDSRMLAFVSNTGPWE